MPEILRYGLAALLMLAGLFVLLSAVLGLFRFRYALSRIHAAALVDTLGILLMLAGLAVAEGFTVTSLKMAAVVVFLWCASPVASHLIGRLEITINQKLDRDMTVEDPAMVAHTREDD
jgi:multicomponent Na+:H+ antiporter subunit G